MSRILIIDDKAPMRILLGHILEDLKDQGIDLLMAADGEEGLELALSEHPDLIFLDVTLPYLSGYEVCQRIKAAGNETYVIFLTGQEVDERQGAEAGVDEFTLRNNSKNLGRFLADAEEELSDVQRFSIEARFEF